MIVVVFHFLRQMPFNPSLRIVLATVLREIVSPSSRRSGKIFGDSNTSSKSPWNQVTFCPIRSVRIARFDGSRLIQA